MQKLFKVTVYTNYKHQNIKAILSVETAHKAFQIAKSFGYWNCTVEGGK